MLGTNDSKLENWDEEAYGAQLRAFIEAYQEVGEETQVYVVQPPRCFPDPDTGVIGYSIRNEIIAKDIYKCVEEAVEETGTAVIDLYSLTEDHEEWFVDGVHPNAQGNRAIAECIYEQIIGAGS